MEGRMPRVGSCTGDYLHLNDVELLSGYREATLRSGSESLQAQIVQDLGQVILWRMSQDPRGKQPAPPKSRPQDCGAADQDGSCLGCGIHVNTIQLGRCYSTEGVAALKSSKATAA